jgi:surfeit locus 1 family protein
VKKSGYHFYLCSALPAALMFVLLLGLGTWQVERLQWKENLIATINARAHEAPVDVLSLTKTQDLTYLPAKASGAFLNDHAFYLLALSLKGEGGYHILTPLKLEDDRIMLVDRGWVPYDHKTNYLEPSGLVSITGVLRAPEHHMFQTPNDPAHNNWYGIDLAAMSQAAGIPFFFPYVLEIDASPEKGSYPIGGQTRVTLPNNHFGYALTWYALALIWLVIYGSLLFGKDPAN